MWAEASRIAYRWAPGVAAPSGPVMALPPRAITTRRDVTSATLAADSLAVKYLFGLDEPPQHHRRSRNFPLWQREVDAARERDRLARREKRRRERQR